MLYFPGDIHVYVKNLTFTLYCGCGGGGVYVCLGAGAIKALLV